MTDHNSNNIIGNQEYKLPYNPFFDQINKEDTRKINLIYKMLTPLIHASRKHILVYVGYGPLMKYSITTNYLNMYDIMALYCKQITLIDANTLQDAPCDEFTVINADELLMPRIQEMIFSHFDGEVDTFSYDCNTNILTFK